MFYLLERSASGNIWRLEGEFETLPKLKVKLKDSASSSSVYRILCGADIGVRVRENIEVQIEV